jgi:hypothetical protein
MVIKAGLTKRLNFISDYELLEVSSDEEGNNRSSLADEKDYVPPSYAVSSINSGTCLNQTMNKSESCID